MKKDQSLTEAGRQYAEAHQEHYKVKDLRQALRLYKRVVAEHPDANEAGYSSTQIQNIVKSMVSKQKLLDVQLGMALAHLKRSERADSKPA